MHSEQLDQVYLDWQAALRRSVSSASDPQDPYVLLHSASMIGLFSCVFVKSSDQRNISGISATEVKTGLGGLHGNKVRNGSSFWDFERLICMKGALAVRFLMDDSSICLINCHLAAGQSQTAHRNKDLAAILESSSLPAEKKEIEQATRFVGGGDGSMILDHEVCILNGDLNYRIDSMSRELVVNAVRDQNLQKILARDQLLLSRKRNPGFPLRAFYESPINFPPTYKYDVGSDRYDTSEKRRAPAWCDRILYRGPGFIKQLDYLRHEVRSSDHRPVSALFKIRLKSVDTHKRNEVWNRGLETFDGVIADCLASSQKT
jgi:endonuclease/exonuclease/phosphatase family metal-dependent hydrolase